MAYIVASIARQKQNKMKRFILVVTGLLLAVMAMAQTLTSPNGELIMNFSLEKGGVPTYTLTFKGKEVVKPSRLGLEFVDRRR